MKALRILGLVLLLTACGKAKITPEMKADLEAIYSNGHPTQMFQATSRAACDAIHNWDVKSNIAIVKGMNLYILTPDFIERFNYDYQTNMKISRGNFDLDYCFIVLTDGIYTMQITDEEPPAVNPNAASINGASSSDSGGMVSATF